MTAELTRELKERALELGFVRAGIARAERLDEEGTRLRAWLAEGRHGTMGYMETTSDVRIDPRHEGMLPGALSVLVLATPYGRNDGDVGPAPAKIARYAQGRDYHNVLGKRARKLGAWLRARGFAARVSVDAVPVFERAWAQRAGIGFIGKNACLIVPGIGSHVLLSTVITNAELVPDAPMKERCGSCTRCLDACPTDAFVAQRELDARKCVSYLTIEHRTNAPVELRSKIGAWMFGCDVCQDVCPYNRTPLPALSSMEAFAVHDRWAEHEASDVLRMSEDEFDRYSIGSPIRRAGRDGMARNAAIVLGNVGGHTHLRVLRETAQAHPSPVVREAAAWAAAHIEGRTDAAGE